ncbi:MAG TPA: penicillin-binding protein [Chitinophagaceae bacterium]|nr:penicillin-binding protein [Chitinophagaceae bacterium]
MSDSLHRRFIPLTAERGSIFSEDGQMLSTSIPIFDIYMDMQADGLREKKGKRFYEQVDSFAIAMADYFGDKKSSQYKKELVQAYNKGDRYFPLKKKLRFEDYKAFRDFPLVRQGRNKSGVITEVNSKRLLPFGLLANRTIGLSREHIASDGQAKKQNVGLEKSYDSLLSGHDGQKLVRFIAGGTAIPVEGTQTDPVNGKDIYTTIDVNIQDITETALLRMMQQCEGPYGTAIVMETSTGKIRAMANLGRRPDGSYWEDDNYALRVTEPGSTIKLATLLSVLEKGSSDINDMVHVGSAGRMEVAPGKVVVDAERHNEPDLTVKGCFAHSSNVGMSKLAYKAFGKNPGEIKKYFSKFRLDQRSPIDLSNLPKPTMAPLSTEGGEAGLGNMLWMSFGYAIQVSPLHTLTLYNAVANDGKMMKPFLVNSVEQSGVLIKKMEPTVLDEQICKPAVIKAAKEAMEMVVTEGTAKKALKDLPFSVAGKTGTAHVSDGAIKYAHGVYQATFVGYFPADKPQFTCIVVIRTKPHAASHYGGTLAAPVFKEIATKLYAMYVEKKTPSGFAAVKDSTMYYYAGAAADIRNILQKLQVKYTDSAASQNWTSVYARNDQPLVKPVMVREKVMPNVRGMGLKDALNLLENMGLKVSVKGKGKVAVQSILPGTQLAKGVTVVLELS